MKVAVVLALVTVGSALHLDDKKPEVNMRKQAQALTKAGDHTKDAEYAKLWLGYGEHAISSKFKEQFKVPQLVCGNKTADEPMGRACEELVMGLTALLDKAPEVVQKSMFTDKKALILELTEETSRATAPWPPKPHAEGFQIKTTTEGLKISASSGPGVLHGAFWLLNLIQRESPVLLGNHVSFDSDPTMPLRIWDLWDNRDRTVERGYAGRSVFYYEELPNMLPRYKDYARLLASTGINSIVWNNVNACFYHNEALLKSETIESMTPLVKLFNDYGIRSFLTPCYESPRLNLNTANPRDKEVNEWWKKKAMELKTKWPEGSFGGFMFKADSEGQPGPTAYGVPEIEGVNRMARALDNAGGIVIWRAFSHPGRGDQDQYLYQAKRFGAWEGKTRDNVVLQMKYGAGDFQSTEPVHALFGKLPSVNKIMEIQATQEYTGQAKHLAHLVPMWQDVLKFDTFANGEKSTVATVLTGHLQPNPSRRVFSGIAAVSNIGDDKTWTGHPMSAANTYGAGRLAWAPHMPANKITKEWVELTFGKSKTVDAALVPMMMKSLDVWENCTAPLGWGWHVGKAKVWDTQHYYMDLSAHNFMFMKADKGEIGVPRTCNPGAVCYNNYYNGPIKTVYGDVKTCPDKMLLHFHRVNYDHVLHDGRKVGDAIYEGYEKGAAESAKFVDTWDTLKGVIDTTSTGMTFAQIREKLVKGAHDARGFATNGTEWFQTVRKGETPFSFVAEMKKAADLKKYRASHPKQKKHHA